MERIASFTINHLNLMPDCMYQEEMRKETVLRRHLI